MIDFHQKPVFRCLKILDLAILRDIDLRREEVCKVARLVVNRADMQLIPESCPIFPIIQEFDGRASAIGDRRPDFRDIGCGS